MHGLAEPKFRSGSSSEHSVIVDRIAGPATTIPSLAPHLGTHGNLVH